MNRKYLLGGALLTTLGLAGTPWIAEALGGGDSAGTQAVEVVDDELEVGIDDFTVEEGSSDATAPGSAGEGVNDELEGLLSAVEGLGANLRGGSDLNTLFGDGGDDAEQSGWALAPLVDADALRARYPLSSLVLGRGRAVAQLGGELATVGSVLSDGRTRVRRITERGVELLHQGEGVWVALPPVRYVPSVPTAASAIPPAAPEPQASGDPLLDL